VRGCDEHHAQKRDRPGRDQPGRNCDHHDVTNDFWLRLKLCLCRGRCDPQNVSSRKPYRKYKVQEGQM
jgi:hypothetical protein